MFLCSYPKHSCCNKLIINLMVVGNLEDLVAFLRHVLEVLTVFWAAQILRIHLLLCQSRQRSNQGELSSQHRLHLSHPEDQRWNKRGLATRRMNYKRINGTPTKLFTPTVLTSMMMKTVNIFKHQSHDYHRSRI